MVKPRWPHRAMVAVGFLGIHLPGRMVLLATGKERDQADTHSPNFWSDLSAFSAD